MTTKKGTNYLTNYWAGTLGVRAILEVSVVCGQNTAAGEPDYKKQKRDSRLSDHPSRNVQA